MSLRQFLRSQTLGVLGPQRKVHLCIICIAMTEYSTALNY